MNIYVDRNGLKEFLSCIYEGKKELKALGKFIKENCQVILLPEQKRKVLAKEDKHPERIGELSDKVNEKRNKEQGRIASLYKELLESKDKEYERFFELLDLWVRDAEILPYENCSRDIDDNFSNFTSVRFSVEQQGVSSAVLRPDSSIKDFLEKLLIKNDPNPSRVLDSKTDKLEWKDLLGEVLPSNEVIIVDPYFLQVKDTSSSRKLLEQILSEIPCHDHVNIIVFCYYLTTKKNNDNNEEQKIGYFMQMKEICDVVKDHKITFVSPKDPEDKLHDRYIISNYKFYLSGHSFSQMFNGESNENVALGSTWFVVNNYIDIQNRDVVCNIINRLKKIVQKPEQHIIGNATSKLLGLEKGHYINFEDELVVEKDDTGVYHCGDCSIFKNKNGDKVSCNLKVKINRIQPNKRHPQKSNYYLYCDDFEIIK